jgi:hypothetical protein
VTVQHKGVLEATEHGGIAEVAGPRAGKVIQNSVDHEVRAGVILGQAGS